LVGGPALGYKRIVANQEGNVPLPGFFRQRLSRFQAVVGITAGLLSIGGMVYSATRHYVKPPVQGDIVAVVQEASSGKPVLDATVEIYTLENRLVTTLSPKQQGRAQQGVNEGPYNLRVSHPRFASQTKQVQVQPGQTSEIHVVLVRPAPLPPPPVTDKPAAKAVTDKPAAKAVADKPAAKAVADKPATRAIMDKPPTKAAIDKPAARAVTDYPAAKAADKPAAKPVGKPAARAVTDKPAAKAVDKPAKVEKKKVTTAPKDSTVRKPVRNPVLEQVQAN
jgi:Carboxypeptidase regulatory-like domain